MSAGPQTEPLPPATGDGDVQAALGAGDHGALARIISALAPGVVRVARAHVPSHAIAEEVVQETWDQYPAAGE